MIYLTRIYGNYKSFVLFNYLRFSQLTKCFLFSKNSKLNKPFKNLSYFCYLQTNSSNQFQNQPVLHDDTECSDVITTNKSHQIIDADKFYKKIIFKIDSHELENNIKVAQEANELFDIITKFSLNFEPHHLEKFIKKLSILNCVDKATNNLKYSINCVEISEQVKMILIKNVIKLAPHFEHTDNIVFLERLIMLGFISEDKCVRAILQLLKHQINSFGKKKFFFSITYEKFNIIIQKFSRT